MVSDRMKPFLNGNSAIRMMFEEGNRLKKIYGEDKVFDFSIGNPNVPAPEKVKEAIIDIVTNEDPVTIHGYMSNAGFEDVRDTIAASLNRRFGTNFTLNNLIMTVGAASGLNIILKTILNPGEEIAVFAPYFPEYGSIAGNSGGRLTVIPPDITTFQPNLSELEKNISSNTRAVIINSPHNPTGVVYSEETIIQIAAILKDKQEKYGTEILLISDEPYRELVYDGAKVPYVTKYYDNTIVAYSYSKSLSLPGERIGYVVIPSELDDYENVFAAAVIANRINGYVNAPSLIQRVIAKCVDEKTNIEQYDRNRMLLYQGLTECGFDCVKPQGAFYLFMKSPVPDEGEFCETARKYNILMVPGNAFGCPGYVRLAYCTSEETIRNSIPEFKKLAAEYFY